MSGPAPVQKILALPEGFLDLHPGEVRARPVGRVPFRSFLVPEFRHAPLNYLDDIRALGFRFAEFDDECLDFTCRGRDAVIFGSDLEFVFTIDLESGVVDALCCEDWLGGEHRMFCNSSLALFAVSFLAFQAEIVLQKVALLRAYGEGRLEAEARRLFDEASRGVGRRIAELDPPAMAATTYWDLQAYRMGDLGILGIAEVGYFATRGRLDHPD